VFVIPAKAGIHFVVTLLDPYPSGAGSTDFRSTVRSREGRLVPRPAEDDRMNRLV